MLQRMIDCTKALLRVAQARHRGIEIEYVCCEYSCMHSCFTDRIVAKGHQYETGHSIIQVQGWTIID